MPAINVFLDSSALLAGIVSDQGASRALLLLGEDQKIRLTVSEQVIVEVERNLARKAPQALPDAREMILHANINLVRDPSSEDVNKHRNWISHPADVPILLAAYRADVARKSGLRLGTPGDALAWVRARLASWGVAE
jgi:predicted nucleic acid-binding protein